MQEELDRIERECAEMEEMLAATTVSPTARSIDAFYND